MVQRTVGPTRSTTHCCICVILSVLGSRDAEAKVELFQRHGCRFHRRGVQIADHEFRPLYLALAFAKLHPIALEQLGCARTFDADHDRISFPHRAADLEVELGFA
jgi:hypothetical protein